MRQRMGRQAAAAVGDVLSRRARLRCACPAPQPRSRPRRDDRRRARCRTPTAFWRGVRDQTHAVLRARRRSGGAPLWRLSVRSTAPYARSRRRTADRMGRRAALARRAASADDAEQAARVGARRTAVTRRCFAPPTSPPASSSRCRPRCSRLHQRLKAAFDPAGILNPRPACTPSSEGRWKPHLADFIRDTPEGREADAILRACVHCGFCTATCPTYQLLGDELDGPRGRIYLIKQMLEGDAVTAKTQLHLDRCLTCRSCETTCPSGVRYGRLRRHRAPRRRRSKSSRTAGERARRWLLRKGLLVAAAVRRGARGRPLARSRCCRARLRAEIPRSRARRRWPAPRHRAPDAGARGLRAAGARAEHRRRDWRACSTASASR